MNIRVLTAIVAATALACGAPEMQDGGPDADDVVGADNVIGDVPTRRDVPTGRDVPSGMDVADVSIETDVADPGDAMDATASTDAEDVSDVPSTTDAVDAADAVDAQDVADVPDAFDVPNVMDVPNIPDVPDPPADTGVCPMGTLTCPGVGCINPLTDNSHCGACGNACPMGRTCQAGMCTCNMGTTLCGGACVNTQSDNSNCGACGTQCPLGQFCAAGACRIDCPPPLLVCGAGANMRCNNLMTDVGNCGACNNLCVTANGTSICSAGVCGVAACDMGFGNCDNNVANGCETNTTNTIAHCGACNNACSVANGSPACNAGSCGVAACNMGFGNCDMNAANGCETNTNSTIAHCGACGNACSVANGSPSCNAGTCGLASCNMGFGNCDMNAANGCETNTTNTIAHCGACNNACSVSNGTPACNAGSCAIASCNMGFGNCDMNDANGCETNNNTSVTHCGACGNACSVSNGTPACNAGSCAIASCDMGFGNCDMNDANGCETNTSNNASHCGACGNACGAVANGSNSCVMGACVAACNMGFDLIGGRCVPAGIVPRPVAPLSLGDVSLRRPTLRWELPAAFDGAVVELCRDRACSSIIESIRALGTTTRPTAALPASSVVFWRLRGTVGAGTSANVSPTWLFHTPAQDNSGGINSSYNAHVDLNGDGYDDLVVGSALADPRNVANAGTATIYHGSAMGLPAMATRTLEGIAAGDRFGISVASAGDVNGDGYGDLVVGASLANPGARTDAGTASIFYGGPTGVAMAPNRTLEGILAGDTFGASVASIGDVDGDGYADIVVGAPLADPGMRTSAGSVSIYHGSAAGIAMAATLVLDGPVAGDQLGNSVSSAGDLNGDGFNDLAIGSWNADPGARANAGTTGIYHGSAMGVPMAATRTLEGLTAGEQFGFSVAHAGDVNGDGYSDLVVGSNLATAGGRATAGIASIFHGSAMGVPMAPARTLEGLAVADQFGTSVASIGDSNGDGFADLVIGAPLADPGARASAGTAAIFNGSALGIAMVATRILEGTAAADQFGQAVGSAGDVNADGFADLGVGATLADPGGRSNSGTASIYLGTNMGVPALPVVIYEGILASDSFGVSVASLGRTAHPLNTRMLRWSTFVASL